MKNLPQLHRNELAKSDNFLTTRQQFNHMLAAATSGALARIPLQPFDVLKIRFQLQVKPLNYKYHNIPQAIKLICHQEGIKALWKGHAPGQLLSILYSMTQFYTYENLNILSNDIKLLKNHPNFTHFLCGSICGAVATIITAPMDTIKTRLIAQDKYHTAGYNNATDAFIKIIKYEGPTGLYRGLTSGLYQIVPFMGLNFMFYNLFGQVITNIMKSEDRYLLPAWCLLVSGAVSGIIAKTIVYPFDLIQMRLQIRGCKLQNQKFGEHFQCNGVWNCLIWIIRVEGFRNLFKGVKPTLIKASLASALHFCFYDKILSIIDHY